MDSKNRLAHESSQSKSIPLDNIANDSPDVAMGGQGTEMQGSNIIEPSER